MEFRKITPDKFNLLKGVDFLFYQPAYLHAQNYENPVAFTAIDQSKLMAAIVFNCKNDLATSLSKSPFGAIWVNPNLSLESIKHFLAFIKETLAGDSICKMQVTLPSAIYSSFNRDIWKSIDFEVILEETNQHILIDGDFESKLHLMERRKLKKLRSGKIKISMEPTSTDVLSECHRFIADCRADQGLKINIELDKLMDLCFSLQGKYDVFTARSGDQLVSAVITCRVNQNHMYYYLPATDYRYRKQSPMVGLVELIYQKCSRLNIQHLDLGVSSTNGELQQGLYDFKERLGALPTTKSTIYCEW